MFIIRKIRRKILARIKKIKILSLRDRSSLLLKASFKMNIKQNLPVPQLYKSRLNIIIIKLDLMFYFCFEDFLFNDTRNTERTY